MANQTTQDLDQERQFIDAGFTKEKVGSVTIYKRPLSKEVIDASVQVAVKRTIGYTSKDIPATKSFRNK
jgi:hypothetical protein